MKRVGRPLPWILVSALVSVACLSKEQSPSKNCRPSYASIPTSKTKALLIGCEDSLSKLQPSHLTLATSYLEPLISTGELDEGALPAINRILTGGKEAPVANVVVRKHGKWLPISSSAAIGTLAISGEQAAALIIGRHELLDSLRERDKRSLGEGLDFLVQSYHWNILASLKDQDTRKRLAEDLCRHLEKKIPGLAQAGESEPPIDLFILSAQIQEPI